MHKPSNSMSVFDGIDRRILASLQSDARMAHAEIGRRVGLSPPAVAERIKKLEDAGVVTGYHARLDARKLGFDLRALIALRAFTGRLKALLERVRTLEEVQHCYRITGNENLIMEVVLHDQEHLERLIDFLIAYGEVRTHLILSDAVPVPRIVPL